VVTDFRNGRLLQEESINDFVSALQWLAGLPAEQVRQLEQAAHDTADAFSMSRSADEALACYRNLHDRILTDRSAEEEHWRHLLDLIKVEWEILRGIGRATDAALGVDEDAG
jgi:hypothetical protein